MGLSRGLILEEKSAEERSSGLEAREERMLSVDDFLLGGAREGVRLTLSSAAAAAPVLRMRLPAGPYSERPMSSEAWSSCCCTPLQHTTSGCSKPCQNPISQYRVMHAGMACPLATSLSCFVIMEDHAKLKRRSMSL